MLDVRHMPEEEKLFNFLSELQAWAQTELRLQGVKDLPSTIAAADRLVDFRTIRGADPDKKKKESGRDKGKAGKAGKDGKFKKKKNKEVTKLGNKDTVQPVVDRMKNCCYLCNVDHCMRNCPKPAKLNALVAEANEDDEGGPFQVNSKEVMSMIDKGATHIVADHEIQKLGLSLT
ncbi:hypothetical protein Salat_1128800 [Sesamum alatum]|uniref:Uncharacterized protein n=1 Tax=Sesamum alatum TaxID=300844 RepID=A0AAE1YDZ2_9LAMI|nr:hypothetical protein Salat_1128800 [Sesamum alatum]